MSGETKRVVELCMVQEESEKKVRGLKKVMTSEGHYA